MNDAWVECLGKVTKLKGTVDFLEGQESLWMDLDTLEHWTIISTTKFRKEKCQVLHLGQGNARRTDGRWVPQEQYSRKGPGNASNISSAQASIVPGSQRANRILGRSKHSTAIQLKDVNVPIFLAPFWRLCAVLVSTVWQACWSPLKYPEDTGWMTCSMKWPWGHFSYLV